MLSSRTEILDAAKQLASILAFGYQDSKGKPWTDDIFRRLCDFSREYLEVDPTTACFHKRHSHGKAEFLWDFLAMGFDSEVLLVAESEQRTEDGTPLKLLRHDFEKLFYAYAPLRLLVCKAKDQTEARKLMLDLESYMGSVVRLPGAILVLHFCFWHDAGTSTYFWQSTGDPIPRVSEKITFGLLN